MKRRFIARFCGKLADERNYFSKGRRPNRRCAVGRMRFYDVSFFLVLETFAG